ncbi:MAG TPA: 50S ribosomal protein L9 [Longimicrobiales bacterium]|nr:50S ribosomal protein L9 [Longimicrobiales bacterium]
MKYIKVILRQDMETLGETGEVVTVRPGYARNYLLPRGFAYEATDRNVRQLEEERQRAEANARRDFLEARRRASLLEGVQITFEARAGEESKLFGSITNADIADRLNEYGLDFTVDRRSIDLEEPLKTLGMFSVSVKLHADVRPEIRVWVVKQD